MPHVEQVVTAIDKIDVAIIRVTPSRWPRLRKREIVSTISESPFAADHGDVTNRKVVVPAKPLAKVFIGDAALGDVFVAFFCTLIVMLFLPNLFVFFFPVLILCQRRKSCG